MATRAKSFERDQRHVGLISSVMALVRQAATSSWNHRYALLAGLAFVVSLELAGYFLSSAADTSLMNLLRDPNAMAGQPWFFGGLEIAGMLILAFLTGGVIFSASLSRGRMASFLWSGGLLSVLLFLDDAYMLHENAYRVGLSENKIFLVYGLIFLAIIGWHWKLLARTPLAILGLSLAFLAFSVLLDNIEFLSRAIYAGEDLSELIGFTLWGVYFFVVGRDAVASRKSATPRLH